MKWEGGVYSKKEAKGYSIKIKDVVSIKLKNSQGLKYNILDTPTTNFYGYCCKERATTENKQECGISVAVQDLQHNSYIYI